MQNRWELLMQKVSTNISIFLLLLVSSQQSFFKAEQTNSEQSTTTEVDSKNDATQKSYSIEDDPYFGRETERPYGKRWEGNLTRLERFRAALYRTFFPTYTEQYLKDVMVSGDTSFDKYDTIGFTLKVIGAATIIGFVVLLRIATVQANTPGTDPYNMEKLQEQNGIYETTISSQSETILYLSKKLKELKAQLEESGASRGSKNFKK